MTCGKGTETGDVVCPSASHPRAILPNAVGAGKVDLSGGISQKPVPANFRTAGRDEVARYKLLVEKVEIPRQTYDIDCPDRGRRPGDPGCAKSLRVRGRAEYCGLAKHHGPGQ
jgi:hypothetical protein